MILLQDVPDGYEYCFAGNGKCPKASSCLRAIAAQLLSESEAPQPQSVRAVNPFYVGSLSGSSTCARYRSSEQLHYARGFDVEKCFELMVAYRSTQPGKIDNLY